MIERVLNLLCRREEIDGAKRCPTYLYRWTLFQPRWPRELWRGFGIYVHKFVGDDWSRDLHDHPKRFISIGIRGSYVEETPAPAFLALGEDIPNLFPCGCTHLKVDAGLCEVYSNREREYQAPWLRTFPAHHVHRIKVLDHNRPCWTLVIVLRSVREWGFWHQGTWIHWRRYVHQDNPIADQRKACP